MTTLWGAYVRHLTRDASSQQQVADELGVSQPTIGRWKRGEHVPNEAALVAAFCRLHGRNPLEGFVAAGMLAESEAGRGLTPTSRRLLEQLRVDAAAVDQAAGEIRKGLAKRRRPRQRGPAAEDEDEGRDRPKVKANRT